MKFQISLLIIVSCFTTIPAASQTIYPPPSGIWCSCPPTNTSGSISVVANVASKPYVKGILVRASWKDLEPVDDNYNWSLIDNQLTAANVYGKKVSLAVGGGPNTPSWVYDAGAVAISYSIPFSGTIPLPWDTIFLKKWTSFVAALGNRYQHDTTIQLVYITNSSGNGFEMQLPFNPTPSYSTLAYTDQKIIDSWKMVADTFNAAFPFHYLTNDYHPVNSSNAVADSLYDYIKATIGQRYGASGWWWTQNNTSVYPTQYAIAQHSASYNSFTGIQMAYSGVNSSGSFGNGGMPAALALAASNNICYCEVWNNDITNGSFDSLFTAFNCPAIPDTVTWTGNTSTDWHTLTNWNINKIPTIHTYVLVPGNTPYNCILSKADGYTAGIEARPGAVITVDNEKKLLVKKQ